MSNQNGEELPKRPKHSCKGCEKRHVGCHSECESYIKYSESLKEYNEYAHKKRMERFDIEDYKSRGAIKQLKKHGKW